MVSAVVKTPRVFVVKFIPRRVASSPSVSTIVVSLALSTIVSYTVASGLESIAKSLISRVVKPLASKSLYMAISAVIILLSALVK